MVLLLCVATIYFTFGQPDDVPVLVARRDIPAYHVITPEDVALATREADEAKKYAALPVEGRLSLVAIGKDQPLMQTDVAPDVAGILGDDLSIHGFDVPPAAVLGGGLRTGDSIRLILREDQRFARLDAVVLAVAGAQDGPIRTLVVAIRAKDASANERAIAVGKASVLKDPAAPNASD
ncbi:SAF domain-containing protein [Paractinoplanes maris]|uniref:SAF domain-containing protein n=1 Tax=Paractinoplanes maris TaxID=1734446 RepID=UPI002021D97E|nr:SAF domain-containing protein [Actinoplanes maris]